MDMHFRDMSFGGALKSFLRFRRSSTTVSTLLAIQTIFTVLLLVLGILAPIGISESRKLSVRRNHTSQGETLCLEYGVNQDNEMIGSAIERVVKHFRAGGNILRLGKTGRRHDAFLMEDVERSLGHSVLVDEWYMQAKLNLSDGGTTYNFDLNLLEFFKNNTGYPFATIHPPDETQYSVVAKNVTFILYGGIILEGPLYITICMGYPMKGRYAKEKCAFSRCTAPRTELKSDEVYAILGSCSVANVERNVFGASNFRTYYASASLLMYLDEAITALDVAEIGKRSMMVSDLSEILRSPKCSDTYVAYLPLSRVSWVSIAILCSLGSISIFWCVAAMVSFFMTKDTTNWNGSCDRVINLAASSDAIS